MEKRFCKECVNYRQHYTFDKRRIFRIYCGHCMVQTSKQRRPETVACAKFTPAPPAEAAFVSKEYLSKELLQYLLRLELLPPIEEESDDT